MLILISSILSLIGTFLLVFFTEYKIDGSILGWTIPLYILGITVGCIAIFVLFIWIYSLIFVSRKKKYEINNFKANITWICTQFLCNLFRIKTVLIGSEKMPESNKFMLVCNHQSIIDPFLMITSFRTKRLTYIMKKEVLSYPAVGRWLYGCGFIPLDRENNRNGLESIVLASKKVANGNSIGVFPEGTRNKKGELAEFRQGVFKIAQRGNAPIVVAVVDNVYRVNKRWPWRSTKVVLKIIDVLPYEEIKDMSTNEISEKVHKLMSDSLEELRKDYNWIGK